MPENIIMSLICSREVKCSRQLDVGGGAVTNVVKVYRNGKFSGFTRSCIFLVWT